MEMSHEGDDLEKSGLITLFFMYQENHTMKNRAHQKNIAVFVIRE